MTAPKFPRPDFSRMVDIRQAQGKVMHLVASEAERIALAKRFELVSIARLEAELVLDRQARKVEATGRLRADIVQSCAVSGEDLPVGIDEPLTLRFVPEADRPPEQDSELDPGPWDEIEYQGESFDVGEAVAQSLALGVDPFAIGPEAERARRSAAIAAEEDSGPFAKLAALRRKS